MRSSAAFRCFISRSTASNPIERNSNSCSRSRATATSLPRKAIAVEIPVYLTDENIAYYQERGFKLNFENDLITGDIDFLQVRDGYRQILDYKPDARKEKHAHVQLTIYVLALARRANLPLKNFKCTWFDEKDYFEFFPLKGVYRPEVRPQIRGVPPQRDHHLAAHGKSAHLVQMS